MAGIAEAAKEQKSSIGKKIDNFTLQDFYGKTHSLSDYSDKKIVVVLLRTGGKPERGIGPAPTRVVLVLRLARSYSFTELVHAAA